MAMAPDAKRKAQEAQKELMTKLGDFLVQADSMKPSVSDKGAFDSLVAAVQQSTTANESVAAFKDRLEKAGKAVVTLPGVGRDLYAGSNFLGLQHLP